MKPSSNDLPTGPSDRAVEWRPLQILGVDYEISSYGDVRYAADGRPKIATVEPSGYRNLSFHGGGKRTAIRVHRLVATAFHGPPPSGRPIVRHLNGEKADCYFENLCWGTYSENMKDALVHGAVVRGSAHENAKLTERTVVALRTLHGLVPLSVLASWLDVSIDTISCAQLGKRWAHVGGQMDLADALRAIFGGADIYGRTRRGRSSDLIIFDFDGS